LGRQPQGASDPIISLATGWCPPGHFQLPHFLPVSRYLKRSWVRYTREHVTNRRGLRRTL
jgi:hypothetical protein